MIEDVKLIIFDLDGTLVNAFDAVVSSVNFALQEVKRPALDPDFIIKNVGWGERSLIAKCVPEEDLDRILSIYRQHHRNALKTGTKFLPGARSVLEHLKSQNIPLAIATNRPSRFTHIILKQLRIRDWFAAILCADDVPNPKPHPDMLEVILKRLKVSQEQALYVGDMAIDAEAGRNAGIRTISVLTGTSTKDEILPFQPFKVFENMKELLKNSL